MVNHPMVHMVNLFLGNNRIPISISQVLVDFLRRDTASQDFLRPDFQLMVNRDLIHSINHHLLILVNRVSVHLDWQLMVNQVRLIMALTVSKDSMHFLKHNHHSTSLHSSHLIFIQDLI